MKRMVCFVLCFAALAISLCQVGLAAEGYWEKPGEYPYRVGSMTLKLRSSASSSASVTAELKTGTKMKLLEKSGAWSKVQLEDGKVGWVASTNIGISVYNRAERLELGKVRVLSGTLKARTSPSSSAEIAATLKNGQVFEVANPFISDVWVQIWIPVTQYRKVEAWVAAAYIGISGEEIISSQSAPSQTGKYSLTKPANWTTETLNGQTYFVAPDKFANVNVVTEDLGSLNMSAYDYYLAGKPYLLDVFPDMSNFETGSIKIGKYDGYRFTWTYVMQGTDVKITQYYAIVKSNSSASTAYIITYLRAAGSNYDSDVAEMIKTFKIT